jgi:hypothetical protein
VVNFFFYESLMLCGDIAFNAIRLPSLPTLSVFLLTLEYSISFGKTSLWRLSLHTRDIGSMLG